MKRHVLFVAVAGLLLSTTAAVAQAPIKIGEINSFSGMMIGR